MSCRLEQIASAYARLRLVAPRLLEARVLLPLPAPLKALEDEEVLGRFTDGDVEGRAPVDGC